MEFRYMLIGTEFYGEGPMFDKKINEEGRNEESAY
jgi:hypothetical protein